MPRASGDPAKATGGSGSGPERGKFLIKSNVFAVRKGDFADSEATLTRVLKLVMLDSGGEPVRGAEEQELQLGCGRTIKNEAGDQVSLLTVFRPGKASSADDEDPTDMGDAVDTEGNTIYCENPGVSFNRSTAFIVFQESLLKCGVPREILDRNYAPDLDGFKFDLETLTATAINAKFGTRLNTKPMKQRDGKEGQEASYRVCVKTLDPNWMKKSSAVTAAKKGAEKATAAASPDDIVTEVIAGLIGSGRKLKTIKAFVGLYSQKHMEGKKSPQQLPACLKLVQDAEWLEAKLAGFGALLGRDDEGKWDGTVEFPGAEE